MAKGFSTFARFPNSTNLVELVKYPNEGNRSYLAGARSRWGTTQKVWGGVEKKHFVLNFALAKASALLRKICKQLTIRAQYIRHTQTSGKHLPFSAKKGTIHPKQVLSLVFKLST
jgi:hypothetical protein